MRALRMIARELAHTGRYQETTDVLMRIKDPYYLTLALCDIAEAIAEDKHNIADTTFSLAIRAANEIRDLDGRAEALGRIADALARIGRFNEAKEVVAGIIKSSIVTRTLHLIAESQALAGI